MARRHLLQEPTSRLAIWARRMALFSLAAVCFSIVIVRSGLVEIGPAIVTFVGALAPAVIALMLTFGAFVVIWKDGLKGLGPSFAAMFISGALPRLSGLSCLPRLQAAVDLRRHHRSDRSAAL